MKPGRFTAFLQGSTLCVCLALGSCAAPSATNQHSIYYAGTPEYLKKAASFRLTLAEANSKVADYIRDRSPDTPADSKLRVTGRHLLILDGAYHFFMPQKAGGIPLTGYYVDGLTGTVEFKVVEGSIPYPGGK